LRLNIRKLYLLSFGAKKSNFYIAQDWQQIFEKVQLLPYFLRRYRKLTSKLISMRVYANLYPGLHCFEFQVILIVCVKKKREGDNMNHLQRKRNWILFISAVLIVASACNLFRALNPADQVISEIEKIATQIPVDQIQEGIDTLSTEMPGGIGDIGDIGDLLNMGDLGDLQATAQAMQEGFEPGEIPPDIPVVEAPKEGLFSSKNLVNYVTQMPLDAVLAFYQTQMPKNDWNPREENNVINEKVSILNFDKPNREAVITLSFDTEKNKTIVLISIQSK